MTEDQTERLVVAVEKIAAVATDWAENSNYVTAEKHGFLASIADAISGLRGDLADFAKGSKPKKPQVF